MIIFNITYTVDKSVEKKWLHWHETTHVEQIMKTGCFKSARFSKILSHSQPDAVNYSIQLFAENKGNLEHFMVHHMNDVMNELKSHFNESVIPFVTEMEYLGDFYFNEN